MRKKRKDGTSRAQKLARRKQRKLSTGNGDTKSDSASGKAKERTERIVVPKRNLLVPMTPFEKRMSRLSRTTPPPSHLQSEAYRARVQRAMDFDLPFQIRLREVSERAPLWAYTRWFGGSGFMMAQTIRHFFLEYWDRLVKHGPHSYPTSFNVMESFLKFEPEYCAFDVRPEVEHLLAATEYFRWYSANALVRKPALVLDAMREGVVYSYNMVGDAGGYRLTSTSSERVAAAVAFVRHENELSCILVAGEKVMSPSADELNLDKTDYTPGRGRENILPSPDLGKANRYLETFPEFTKVLVLTRVDLIRETHNVRYVNVDTGPSYRVFTDDEEVFADIPVDEKAGYIRSSLEGVGRYDDLFSLLASLMYLPLLFVDKLAHVSKVVFKTELFAKKAEPLTVKAEKLLGQKECCFERTLTCLATSTTSAEGSLTVTPPGLQLEASGYWKPLDPGCVGEDHDGNPIVGRTWVERSENWSSNSPSKFVLQQIHKPKDGPDPGVIYVMREPASMPDVYKIGLTRRTAGERARELYTTGVPLPFGVLAHWNVSDCAAVEKEAHIRLAARRISIRREFFRAPLEEVTATILEVIRDIERRSAP